MSCVLAKGCMWPEGHWICSRSCEQRHARELTERWRREKEERTARGVYRGCPVCFQEVLFHCHHDGMDIDSVDLPLEKKAERRELESQPVS